MEVTGIILQKLGESTGTGAKTGMPWRIAEFLFEIPGEYKRHINFKVRDGQYGLIERFESLSGKVVKVSFGIEAHESNGRWYNEIRAWGVMEYVSGKMPAADAVTAGGSIPGAADAESQRAGTAQQHADSFAELERNDAMTPPDYKTLGMDSLPF